MTKEEQEKFELLISAVVKIQEFKDILVKSTEYHLAATLRDFEKAVHQSISDFFNIKKRYTEGDLKKAFYDSRAGMASSTAHSNELLSLATYKRFEDWFCGNFSKSGWVTTGV